MRTVIISILFCVALVLLMAESDNVAVLLASKAAAFAVGYAAVRLSDRSTLSDTINAKED